MGEMARRIGCDPSYATALVDDLDTKGPGPSGAGAVRPPGQDRGADRRRTGPGGRDQPHAVRASRRPSRRSSTGELRQLRDLLDKVLAATEAARPGLNRWRSRPSRGERAGGAGRAPLEVLRRERGRARRQLRGPAGRGVRAARAQRGRQDDHSRDPRGFPRPQRRSRADARRRPGRPGHAALAAHPYRRGAPGAGRRAVLLGAPGAEPQRRLLPAPAAGRRGDRADRPEREGRRPGQAALGRPAAPPRRRPGHHRQPRTALPRRAHDGPGPLRPARDLGPHPAPGGRRGPRCS